MAKANNSRRPSNNPNDNNKQPSPWPPNSKAKNGEKAKDSVQKANGTPLPSPPQSPKKETPHLGNASQTVSAADEKRGKPSRLNTSTGPANGSTSTTAATVGPSGSTGLRDPATAAVSGLIGAMKDTVGALSATFDALESQTTRVAELGPAMDAMYQVQVLRSEVEQQQYAQEQRMQDEKERLQEQLKTHIRETLRPLTNQIIADVVKREVVERVRQKLSDKIPASLCDDVRGYKLQILQARAKLHNSEARRHNALIRGTGLDEPLQPLLRPLDIPGPSQADGTHLATPPATAPSTMSAASLKAQVGVAGRDSTRLSVNTNMRAPRPAGTSPRSAVGTTTPGGTRMTPLVPPTPSPLFPPNLSILVSLGPDEVKALVREYGLTSDNDDDGAVDDDDLPLATKREARKARPVSYMTNVSDAGQSWVEAGLDGTREDELNKFMRYIGVGFQVLPSSPIITLGDGTSASFSTGIPTSPGGLMRSPLVERPEYAFVR